MIITFIRRVLPVAMIAAVLGLLVRAQKLPTPGGDGWLHLRMGAEFLDGWSIAHPGNLSRFDTAQWYPTQWLSQIAMSKALELGGVPAVMWLCGVIVLLLPITIYLLCRATTSPLPAAVATTLAVLAAAPGLSARPQVVSYVLIVVVSGAWLATARDGRARWWLVPLAWIWVPIHGMWVIGILIGIVVLVGIALERRHSARHLLTLAAIPLLSVLVAALTPLGLNAYASVVAVGSRTDHLSEWGSPEFTTPTGLILAGVMAVLVVLMLRDRSAVDWPTLLFLGLAMAWALYTTRTMIVSAVMIAPLLAGAIQRYVPAVPRADRRELAALAASFVVAAGALALVCQAKGDDDVVPGWVDARLSAMEPGTAVLNNWNEGAYLLWRHPDLQLVMHGYVDVFTEEEVERNADILSLEPGWDEQVRDLDVDVALVDPDTSLGYALTNDLGWSVIEADDDYALLSPRD